MFKSSTKHVTQTAAALALAASLIACGGVTTAGETDPTANEESPWAIFSFGDEAEPITLPAGTPIRVQTTSTLSTAANNSGEEFVATLVDPIIVGETTIAEAGSTVVGVITNADKGGRVKGVASIGITLLSLDTVSGTTDIQTTSYAIRAKKTHGKDAQKIGIGAGVGALIGGVTGGGKGAAAGAGLGGGAGTGAVLATRGDAATIPAESTVTVELQQPVTVTP